MNTRMGKTNTMRAFDLAAPRDCITLIHDGKPTLHPQYPGHVLHVASLDGAPGDASVFVFRNNPRLGLTVTVDAVARLAWELACTGVPVRLRIDELSLACTPKGRELASPFLLLCLTQGGGLGMSVDESNQIAKNTPAEPIDTSTFTVLGNLGKKSLNYLDDQLELDPEVLSVVESLQRGEVVIVEPASKWNRTIYTVPWVPLPAPPAAAAAPAPAAELPPVV